MLGFTKNMPKINSVYYAEKPLVSFAALKKQQELPFIAPNNIVKKQMPFARNLPGSGRNIATPIVPIAPQKIPVVHNPLQQQISALQESYLLVEEVMRQQAQEIARLKEDIDMAGFGSLVVRFLEDSPPVRSLSGDDDASLPQIAMGTRVVLRSPYEENEHGLWATRQIMTLTSEGMLLKGYSVLIARLLETASDGTNSFQPLVEVFSDD